MINRLAHSWTRGTAQTLLLLALLVMAALHAPALADGTQATSGRWYNPLSWWNGESSQQAAKPSPEALRAQKRLERAERAAQRRQEAAQKKQAKNARKAQRLADRERNRISHSAHAQDGAVIETQRGDIAITLYENDAPKTVANFKALAERGFYNGNMVFHRVVPGFVVQTGDPTGTGYGGSDKRIALEVKNKLSHDAKGVVAMARGAGPDSATSQFYITLAPQTSLDGKYAIFGRVISGLDVLDKIGQGDRLYGVRLITLSSGAPQRLMASREPAVDTRAVAERTEKRSAKRVPPELSPMSWPARTWGRLKYTAKRLFD